MKGGGSVGVGIFVCWLFFVLFSSPLRLNIRDLLDKKTFRLSHLGVLCQSILAKLTLAKNANFNLLKEKKKKVSHFPN